MELKSTLLKIKEFEEQSPAFISGEDHKAAIIISLIFLSVYVLLFVGVCLYFKFGGK